MSKQITTIKNPAECENCGFEWDSDLKVEVEISENGVIGAKLIGFERNCPICKSEDITIHILDETENVVDESGG